MRAADRGQCFAPSVDVSGIELPSNLCSSLCWTTGDSNKWLNFSVTLVLISVYLRVNDACVCL